eukprot:121815-Pelagomonas_calceolata.AAC.5
MYLHAIPSVSLNISLRTAPRLGMCRCCGGPHHDRRHLWGGPRELAAGAQDHAAPRRAAPEAVYALHPRRCLFTLNLEAVCAHSPGDCVLGDESNQWPSVCDSIKKRWSGLGAKP